jgi:hypothetical protein
VFVDDATSRLMHLQFVESESTFAYFHAARAYLESWGKPVAFYSDKHGVFRVNHPGALGGDGMTQFGRALHALNIDVICANSSPAKGRVERAHKTLQDRLVKELRLAGVRNLADGNALLPDFVADYNARFAKLPANKKDLHRPLCAGDDLDDAFAWKEQRRLSQALTLQYDKVMVILEPSEPAKAAISKYVTVFDYPDGRLVIRHNGIELAYRTFDKIRQVDQGAIADNKHLGAVLAMIRDEQLRRVFPMPGIWRSYSGGGDPPEPQSNQWVGSGGPPQNSSAWRLRAAGEKSAKNPSKRSGASRHRGVDRCRHSELDPLAG